MRNYLRSLAHPILSRFIEISIRPHVAKLDWVPAYQEMAEDEAREAEALEWAEGMIGDVNDAT